MRGAISVQEQRALTSRSNKSVIRQNKPRGARAKALDTRSLERGKQVLRLFTILRALDGARRGLTVAELHALLDERCTLRTVYRDIDQLQQAGFALEEEDGRYRLAASSHRLQTTPLKPHEVLTLLLSGNLLEPLAPTALAAAHAELQERLLANLTPEGRQFVFEQRSTLRGTNAAPTQLSTPTGVVAAVEEAHEKEHLLRIKYHAPNKAPTERVVEPHLFWVHAGRPYVVAYCHNARDFRSFAMQRITAAEVLDVPFERRTNFDAKAFTERGFGVHHGEPHAFAIEFGPSVAHLARERVWHPTQRLEALPNGGVSLQFAAGGLPEVAAWVASFGGAVRAIEPAALVEAVRRLHEEGLRVHGLERGASAPEPEESNISNRSEEVATKRKNPRSKPRLTSIVKGA